MLCELCFCVLFILANVRVRKIQGGAKLLLNNMPVLDRSTFSENDLNLKQQYALSFPFWFWFLFVFYFLQKLPPAVIMVVHFFKIRSFSTTLFPDIYTYYTMIEFYFMRASICNPILFIIFLVHKFICTQTVGTYYILTLELDWWSSSSLSLFSSSPATWCIR